MQRQHVIQQKGIAGEEEELVEGIPDEVNLKSFEGAASPDHKQVEPDCFCRAAVGLSSLDAMADTHRSAAFPGRLREHMIDRGVANVRPKTTNDSDDGCVLAFGHAHAARTL